MNSEQQYIDLFRAHRDLLEQHAAPVTNRPREEAAALLEQQGLPDRKTERYKYTDARAAFAPNFGVNLKRLLPKANPYDTFRCQVPNLSTSLFFVLNDVPVPAPLHTQSLLPEGVTVDSFSRMEKKRPGWLEAFYHRAASHERDFKTGHDGVTLLNTMLAQDGLLIHVPAGVKLKTPIQVVNMSVAASDFLSLRRVLIVAEEDAEVSVLFCEHAEGTPAYLTSEVMEVYGGANSSVSLYSIEETNERCTAFRNIFTEQQSGSRVTCHSVTLTCGTSRTRLDARLKGEGAVCEAFGAMTPVAWTTTCSSSTSHPVVRATCYINMCWTAAASVLSPGRSMWHPVPTKPSRARPTPAFVPRRPRALSRNPCWKSMPTT